MAKPRASRPSMPPEYGILGPAKGKGLLPWSWAAERLASSRSHWIATTRSDGRPHLMVVWGVWLDDKFCFSTSKRSQKARNLAATPACVVSTERADQAVILEGVAEEVTNPKLVRQFEVAYRQKYHEDIDTKLFSVYAVRPQVAFGFISDPNEWAGSATRWRFRGEPGRGGLRARRGEAALRDISSQRGKSSRSPRRPLSGHDC